jgi:putative hydrolase of HD superfamily
MTTNPSSEIPALLRFVSIAEGLKRELRHSWLADGRRESVAEHTWMMSLLAILFAKRLDAPIDLERTLKIVIVHDLVEALCGDVPSFEDSERMQHKAEREHAAMQQLRSHLPDDLGAEISALWHEFEARETAEARFAVALDKLEVQLQHNLAPFKTWEPIEYDLVYTKVLPPCAHDGFLADVARAVMAEAERKMTAGGIDVAAVRARHGATGATP